jgi:hypothetical protein
LRRRGQRRRGVADPRAGAAALGWHGAHALAGFAPIADDDADFGAHLAANVAISAADFSPVAATDVAAHVATAAHIAADVAASSTAAAS